MTLEELHALREKMKSGMEKRIPSGKDTQIIVGLGTCGIAKGARAVLNEFVSLIDRKGLASSVIVRQTGCMGHCADEPTVEVIAPGMPKTIYGKVNAEIAAEIVEKHIIGKKLIENRILK